MKGKRVLSLALAALMTLSLLVVPAAAVSFTDMTNHWAKDEGEYLATQGVVKGTSATTFAPDQKMTACEALLFCSRAAGVDAIDKEAIAEDWEDELWETFAHEFTHHIEGLAGERGLELKDEAFLEEYRRERE